MAQPEPLNLERLLAPVRADQPCGEDLAFSPEIDAIQRARQADDPSIEQGAWVTDLKEADWKFVGKQCAGLIAARSKDLQLAVWLAEAACRTGGLQALGDSLLLIARLCDQYWDGMYPLLEDDGIEQRIGNLAWVASRSAHWVRDVPLTPSADGVTLRDVDTARAHGGDAQARIDAARQRGPESAFAALLAEAAHCASCVDALERSADVRLGADGPSFGAVRAALEDVRAFLAPLVKGAAPVGKGSSAVAVVAQQGVAPVPVLAAGGPLQSRAQALAQLRAVADYFRRTEPHSPVAYLADRAAAWGEQPLHVWLRGVIKDDASFAHVEELLGVTPRS